MPRKSHAIQTLPFPEKQEILDVFGNNIKNIRTLKDMTQHEFARQLGINRNMLASYEEKRATPTLPVLIVISNKLDFTIEDLLTRDILRKEE